MTRQSIYAYPTKQTSALSTLPAPVGGLNARDSLANMPPTQAVLIENLFPTSGGVQVRKGWCRYYYSIPAVVETIIKYNSPSGVEKIFAAAGGNFIDASGGGSYSGADVAASGFANDRWQYVQMANLFGDFTVAVNGADTPQKYDGATWADATITAPVEFTDFDPKNFIHIAQMHRRLWFVEKDSARVWYLPVDQIEGEVALFDCGELFPLGGYCQFCISWSVDTGAGMDDQSVFVSSKGNVVVFSGFDPDDATTFTLAGVYTIGATVGRRCACPYGSDVFILTEDGVVALTSVLSQSKMLMQPPVSDIIQPRLSQLVDEFSGEFGWDLFTSARHNQLYINVPATTQKYQYVMNTILDAWCVFLGYKANCWENFYEEPVFGGTEGIDASEDDRVTSSGDMRVTSFGDQRITGVGSSAVGGYVGKAWAGYVDDPSAETGIGTSIVTRCLQAFNYFGGPQQKMWSLARPILLSELRPQTSVFFNTDFEITDNLLPLTPVLNTGASYVWDTALWDVAVWAGQKFTFKDWYSLNDLGFAGAIFLKTGTVADTSWVATDFQFIKGGTL